MSAFITCTLLLAASAPGAETPPCGPLFPAPLVSSDITAPAPADVDEDGLADLLVGLKDGIDIRLAHVDGTFTSVGVLAVVGWPKAVWARDMDGDDHVDIVASIAPPSFSGPHVVVWARGHGDGTFEPATQVASHDGDLHGEVLTDLDRDGHHDLVALRSTASPLGIDPDPEVIFHRGLGAQGFAAEQVLLTTAAGGVLAVGDVSGDGAPDIIVGHQWIYGVTPESEPLEIWLADPSGAFVRGPPFAPDGPYGIPVAADLDEDGRIDLAVTLHDAFVAGPSQVVMYRGLSGGVFARGQVVAEIPGAWAIAVDDLDTDGHVDLLVGSTFAAEAARELRVYRGLGDGSFEAWQHLAGVFVGPLHDMDLDGDRDLVSGYVVPNLGDGRLARRPSVPVGDKPTVLLAEDVDGDGQTDLVLFEETDQQLRVLLGRGNAHFVEGSVVALGYDVRLLVAGDLDGDGLVDLVAGGEQVRSLRGDGAGGFGPPVDIDWNLGGSSTLGSDMRLADVNGDSVLDLLASRHDAFGYHGSSSVLVAAGVGDGTFAPPSVALGTTYVYSFDVGELDGDGLLDVACVVFSMAGPGSGIRLTTLAGQGDGTFAISSQASLFSLQTVPADLVLADVDHDERLDLLAVAVDGSLRVYRGLGDGTLGAPEVQVTSGLGSSIQVADVDHDGILDVLAPVVVARGRGDGSFDAVERFWGGSSPSSIALGDWNGDGRTDLACTDRGSDSLRLLLQQDGARWCDLGGALDGSAGAPRLVAGGTLKAGSPTRLILSRAAPGAHGFLVIGARLASQPLAGGVLLPAPDVVRLLAADAAGRWQALGRWPDGLPSGQQLHIQAWILDGAGPFGFAASNGLTATAR